MKKYALALVPIISLILGTSCTEKQRAKAYGGTATIELKPKHKLVDATWKGEADLWYLARPMREGEVAETYAFQEDSNYGFLEGTVIFKESK